MLKNFVLDNSKNFEVFGISKEIPKPIKIEDF